MSENENTAEVKESITDATAAWQALCINPKDTLEHQVTIDDKVYTFKLRVLTWPEVEKLRSDHTVIDRSTRNIHFKEAEYAEKLINKILVSGPFEEAKKKEFIKHLRMDVKDGILQCITKLHSLPAEIAKN